MLFAGLDVGTQGARVVVLDEEGRVVAGHSQALEEAEIKELPPECSEQDPCSWWKAASACLRQTVEDLKSQGRQPEEVETICVASTSGTIFPVDEAGEPLRPALMYNDSRAIREAGRANSAGEKHTRKLGYLFQASFSLSKILWIKEKEPRIYGRAKKFLHASDYLGGKLSGDFSVTDTSNALKTGYDLVSLRWPRFLSEELDIAKGLLPRVVKPGEVIGSVSSRAEQETGLSGRTRVVGGMTDGVASLVASGAVAPGQWCSALGTTLVVKGVSRELLRDREGRIYCHLHPDGYWLPGGASSVGGECLEARFSDTPFSELDQKAEEKIPTNLIIYPLVRKGERLPFVNPEAEGFIVGKSPDRYTFFAAHLEGVAMIERWAYELLGELGGEVGKEIRVTGGGAQSSLWLRIRAAMLGKVLVLPENQEAAFGAAMVGAGAALGENLVDTARRMVRVRERIEPDETLGTSYRKKYRKFREACRAIGYE